MSWEIITASVVLALTLFVYKFFIASPVSKSFASMPGPRQPLGPFIGSMPIKPLMQQHLNFVKLVKKYGPIVRRRVLFTNIVLVADPTIAKSIIDNKEAFPDRAPNGMRFYMEKSLLGLPTGPTWKTHRTLVSKIFADKYIRQYTNVFVAKSLVLVDQLNQLKPTDTTNIHLGVSKLSLDVIGVSGLGNDFHVLDQNNREYYDAANLVNLGAILRTMIPITVLYRLLQPDNHRKSQAARQLYHDLIIKIRSNRVKSDARTLIDILDDGGLSEDEIVDEIMAMVLAGHETTANTIAWAISLLAVNPEAMRKAQAEVDEVWQAPGFDPTTGFFEVRGQLPYIRAVFDETLRIYPTVPSLPRICVQETQVGPYDIPPGAIVYIASAALGRDARNFENPEKFQPERFLHREKDDPEKPRYFPFGGGNRACVGRRFAEVEGITVIATLVHFFDFELDTSKPIVEESHITLTSQSGIWVRVKKRNHD